MENAPPKPEFTVLGCMKLGRKRQPLSQLQVYCKDTHLICAVNLFLLSKKFSADRRAVLNILRDLRLHQSQRPRVNTEATHPDHHIRFPILQALTFKRGSCWEDNEKSNTSSRWSCAAAAQRERDLAGNASTETRAAPSEGLREAVSTRPNPAAAPQGSARLGSPSLPPRGRPSRLGSPSLPPRGRLTPPLPALHPLPLLPRPRSPLPSLCRRTAPSYRPKQQVPVPAHACRPAPRLVAAVRQRAGREAAAAVGPRAPWRGSAAGGFCFPTAAASLFVFCRAWSAAFREGTIQENHEGKLLLLSWSLSSVTLPKVSHGNWEIKSPAFTQRGFILAQDLLGSGFVPRQQGQLKAFRWRLGSDRIAFNTSEAKSSSYLTPIGGIHSGSQQLF